jgi:hypothetical protein
MPTIKERVQRAGFLPDMSKLQAMMDDRFGALLDVLNRMDDHLVEIRDRLPQAPPPR